MKKNKPKRRAKKRLKVLILLLLFTLAVALVMVTPLFNVSDIKVKGESHYKKEQIADASGLIKGENAFKTLFYKTGSIKNVGKLLLLRPTVAEENIYKNCPYVKEVFVRYSFPKSFNIDVIERTPAFYSTYMGQKIILDEEGYVLEAGDNVTSLKLPLINGLEIKGVKAGQALNLKDTYPFKTAVGLIKILNESDSIDKNNIIKSLSTIDVADTKRVSLTLDSRVNVVMGDTGSFNHEEFLRRVNFFKEVYAKNLNKEDKGTLEFSSDGKIDFLPLK